LSLDGRSTGRLEPSGAAISVPRTIRTSSVACAASVNGMARPRPAPNLVDLRLEALRKAQGACDAHISEDTGNHPHDRDRPRQEHIPLGWGGQAGDRKG